MEGWLCPRCGRSNAPWVHHCDCMATWTSSSNTCLHNSIIYDTSGMRCADCGYVFSTQPIHVICSSYIIDDYVIDEATGVVGKVIT